MQLIIHGHSLFEKTFFWKGKCTHSLQDEAVKVELSAMRLDESHAELIPFHWDKWFKYWHPVRQREAAEEGAWRLCWRNPSCEISAVQEDSQSQRELHNNSHPPSMICTLQRCGTRTTWGHCAHHRDAMPSWIITEQSDTIPCLVQIHYLHFEKKLCSIFIWTNKLPCHVDVWEPIIKQG